MQILTKTKQAFSQGYVSRAFFFFILAYFLSVFFLNNDFAKYVLWVGDAKPGPGSRAIAESLALLAYTLASVLCLIPFSKLRKKCPLYADTYLVTMVFALILEMIVFIDARVCVNPLCGFLYYTTFVLMAIITIILHVFFLLSLVLEKNNKQKSMVSTKGVASLFMASVGIMMIIPAITLFLAFLDVHHEFYLPTFWYLYR